MRIVARLKRGSLFRLLFYADARRAPHASHTASSSSFSSSFSSSSVTLTLHARLHVGTTRTFAHSRTSDISRPSVRWKSNSIWRREYGRYSHPPLSVSLAPFYLSRPAQASNFLMLNSTSRCMPTLAFIGNANCGERKRDVCRGYW